MQIRILKICGAEKRPIKCRIRNLYLALLYTQTLLLILTKNSLYTRNEKKHFKFVFIYFTVGSPSVNLCTIVSPAVYTFFNIIKDKFFVLKSPEVYTVCMELDKNGSESVALTTHCPNNNLNLNQQMSYLACDSWRGCNSVLYTEHISPVFVYKYSIQYSTVSCPSASAPTVAGLVLMRRFRLFLGQDIFSRNETSRNTFLIQKRL